MIDSHAHLTHPDYRGVSPGELIGRAAAAGVEGVVCVAYDIPSCEDVVRLAESESAVRAVVGIHPHEADRALAGDLARVEELAKRPKVVGIGETGLDFYRDYADRKNQERLFHEQLSLAARVGKPVVIHDREAHDTLLSILVEHEKELTGGVLHCFSGGRSFMEKVLPLGLAISVPGTLTFAKGDGKLADVVRSCPEDRILVETDCPWLAPVPHRGKRNEPAYVRFVLEKVAEIRGKDLRQMDRITTENTRRVFLMEGAA
ncbi:MAG: TatD family hydrolase [Candidatus Eisenbacteria bacterium]